MKVSVAIITLNEEDRLPLCLESLSFADEIVVIDCGSKDNTVTIAESFGCKVLFHPWQGYARQKQYAVDQCGNDWVLILDADERVPEQTSKIINKILTENHEAYAGYSFHRKNFFHGKWIRHCGWWPNRVLRLVDRRQGRFSDDLVHEKWLCDGLVKGLDVAIEHYSFRNYADLIHKMQSHSTLAAEQMVRKGRRSGWWSPISHGVWTFLRTYFLEMGMLEGFDGLVIALTNAGGSFMKYAKLREANLYQQK